jgi:hypothetical protein
LSDGCNLGPGVGNPDDGTRQSDAVRFLEQAFSRLGQVTVFSFADGGFMLLGPSGDRVHGDSLVAALLAMLEPVDQCVQRLLYRRTSHLERPA